ncbi:calponin homology domain-containing protein DDB_G0272472-like isoform X5 [Stegodyphus dumicola]|uniref:calponin homology domain-containing protein DDB_G0272472-like isoform X5 n=1 Tax=Stegodyphus dumicola TaxID=202533 RepID=UPI0015A81574|nr:calponin homology domain-containing protein DDB_G0272472-like isoform X5 [Stegodyphus dumicola]
MASVPSFVTTSEEKKVENEKLSSMSVETSVLNKTPPRESYWFAHGGIEEISPGNLQSGSNSAGDAKEIQLQKDKEERIRHFREQQEEERLRKLKDLEQQFLLAKKHREQQEEERKRKIEEARIREMERRQQVEERKRQIWEAEQERKEAILRRNMEREARIEARRNAQRNSQCFAFGSSTPRTFDLDLAAIGVGRNVNQGTVLMSSVSGRRSEERDLGPPRATSACSLDRKFGDDCMSRSMVSLSSSAFRGRKRTDIMPTLTRERSITPHITPRGKDASRSPSRPQSSMSGASEISATSSSVSTVNMRPRVAPRRPRPYSIAGSTADRTSMTSTSIKKEVERPPTATRKDPERPSRSIDKNVLNTVQKPQRAKSASKEKDEAQNTRPSMPKKPVPPPKSLEVLARAKSHPVPIKDNLRKNVKPNAGVNNPALGATKPHTDMKGKSPEIEHIKPSIMKSESETKSLAPEMKKNSPVTSPTTDSEICISSDDSKVSAVTESEVNTMTQSATDSEWRLETSEISSLSKSSSIPVADQNNLASEVDKSDSIPNIPKEPIKAEKESNIVTTENLETHVATEVSEKYATTGESEKCLSTKEPSKHEHMKQTKVSEKRVSTEESERRENVENENVNTKEFIPSKPRITSEEEAKAALAEKRRLAREQAEREAELERQRLEEIRRKEEEQRRLEELEQKRMEEEQIRLAELHRQLEEEKLRKAIEEQKQREREEQERKEEEARQKAEKEEQERKAREEAERQRIELEERLKKEEEERAERKRRVEQIMARTRAKAAASSSNSQNENIVKSTKAAEMSSSATSIEASKQNILPQANNIVNISNGGFETKVENSSVSFSATTNHVSNSSSWPFSDENRISHKEALPDLLNTENISNHSNKSNGFCVGRSEQLVSNSSVSNSFKITSNRTLSANEVTSPSQTNGYSSHEEMSCTTSPEEMSNAGLLISIETSQSKSNKVSQDSTDFTKLVDIEPSSLDNNVNNENYLINVDDVNSNLLNSENPFMTFEDSLSKKQESPFTDLLS